MLSYWFGFFFLRAFQLCSKLKIQRNAFILEFFPALSRFRSVHKQKQMSFGHI